MSIKQGRVVQLRGIKKAYAGKPVLDGVDLAVHAGQVLALVGENGAGKTSLLEILMNMRTADAGQAIIFGLNALKDNPAIRAQIGFLSETVPMFEEMSVSAALDFHGTFFDDWDNYFAHTLMDRLKLNASTRLAELSRGQKLRVGLITALAHHPKLFIFDEFTESPDPLVRHDILKLVHEEVENNGSTVIFATKLLNQLNGFATHITFLRNGKLDPVESLPGQEVDLEAWFISKYQVKTDV